jgi:hypothetical protein
MAIYEHVTEFAGKSVIDYEPESGIRDPAKYHYRIGFGYEAYEAEEPLTNRIAAFLDEPDVDNVTGIVIGSWEEVGTGTGSGPIVEALVAAKQKLPNLRAIFLGDIICEESEISWILQSDVSPLFLAYPQLEHFRVRGNEGLSLGSLKSDSLKSLVIETGGLSATIVRQVAAADLPSLEHLELWLGTDEYGGDATLRDLDPTLSGKLFPKLQYLGLRDSTFTDDIAIAAAKAPITERIKVLDLSLGTLSDKGARALFNSPSVKRLEKLDLHYHYLSTKMMNRFKQLDIHVDLSDQQEEDIYDGEAYRYPAVTE